VERDIVSFSTPAEFELWLEAHHGQATGIWILIAKKGSERPSISYKEALDCALCYGWIDGQKDRRDESSWLQHFSRRKRGSIWSQVNKKNVERLIEEGRMRAPGLAAIEEARRSGEWEAAYQATASRDIPPELEAALAKSRKARAFFETLNSQNRYAFVFRVSTAKKAETKQRRVEEFIRMMENGEVFYPKKAKDS